MDLFHLFGFVDFFYDTLKIVQINMHFIKYFKCDTLVKKNWVVVKMSNHSFFISFSDQNLTTFKSKFLYPNPKHSYPNSNSIIFCFVDPKRWIFNSQIPLGKMVENVIMGLAENVVFFFWLSEYLNKCTLWQYLSFLSKLCFNLRFFIKTPVYVKCSNHKGEKIYLLFFFLSPTPITWPLETVLE